MATQTAIVHESIVDDFLKLLTADFPRASASLDDGAALRGLFTAASAERVQGAIEDALSKGAKIAAGENKREGNVIQPCLLRDVTDDMRIYREEMFAPVFSVLTFRDDEQALRYANDHEYGLSAAVFTQNIDRGLRLADGIESGAVHINGATVHDHGQVPHGGTKASGYGRFNGAEGIRCVASSSRSSSTFPLPFSFLSPSPPSSRLSSSSSRLVPTFTTLLAPLLGLSRLTRAC